MLDNIIEGLKYTAIGVVVLAGIIGGAWLLITVLDYVYAHRMAEYIVGGALLALFSYFTGLIYCSEL